MEKYLIKRVENGILINFKIFGDLNLKQWTVRVQNLVKSVKNIFVALF